MQEVNKLNFDWPILGHKNVINYLQKLIINKQFVRSFLFTGPEDIGKKTVVQNFVKSIFCLREEDFKGGIKKLPCNECEDCQQMERGIHPDYIFLDLEDDKKNISIEKVRKFQERLYLTPARSNYKVGLINQAEDLSLAAANALLKTIEEPPKNSIIILIANRIEKILPTIKSRTQNIIFQNLPLKEIYDYLIAKGATGKIARELSDFSGGVPGIAMAYYQNLEKWTSRKEDLNNMLEVLVQPFNDRLNWVEKKFKFSKKAKNQYNYFEILLNSYLHLTRDLIVSKINPEMNLIHPFLKESVLKVASKYSEQELLNFYKEILQGKKLIAANSNPMIVLENLVLI